MLPLRRGRSLRASTRDSRPLLAASCIALCAASAALPAANAMKPDAPAIPRSRLLAASQARGRSGPPAVDGKAFDLIVVGGTPAGVATAVRAAREGLTVL